jgi:hypothetical protein
MHRNIRIHIYNQRFIRLSRKTPPPPPQPVIPQNYHWTQVLLGTCLTISEFLPFLEKTKGNGVLQTLYLMDVKIV